jgi:hypothetical protein
MDLQLVGFSTNLPPQIIPSAPKTVGHYIGETSSFSFLSVRSRASKLIIIKQF